MEIIPVIDLMRGQVVHAKLGQREHYQPIQSLLCLSSTPLDIVNAFVELYPFACLYIADLDAITGFGHHLNAIRNIQEKYPNIEIWLDAGIQDIAALKIWSDLKVTHVIGSENINSIKSLKNLHQQLNGHFVLSLDFNQSGFLGCTDVLTNTEYWPNKVIVMTLNHVGSQLGLDVEKLMLIKSMAIDRQIYAAGGVRNNDDIDQLQALNITGALVATALHNKQISMLNIKNPASLIKS
jgi:phosphoribosylformimino-5-aminoimidazole carboxamide ribotide isomerase